MSLQRGQAYIIVPTEITSVELISSTIPEPDTGEVAWNPATAYSQGDRAYLASNQTIYYRLVAGTTATSPLTDTTNWVAAGRLNKWAMFDNTAGTVSTDTGALTVVLEPGQCGAIFAKGVVGTLFSISVKNQAGGTVVYSRDVSLDDTVIESVYDWFFTDFEQRDSVVLTDLPSQFLNPEVTITITGATAQCESLRIGQVYNIGGTLMGASLSTINYSRKTTDDYGVTTITPRGFSKRMTCKVLTSRANFRRIDRLLTELKDTLAVYVASLDSELAPLNVQGIPADCSIDVEYASAVQCNLQIEGISL